MSRVLCFLLLTLILALAGGCGKDTPVAPPAAEKAKITKVPAPPKLPPPPPLLKKKR